MTRIQRLRRTGILCCHCLRNLAFYRSAWRKGSLKLTQQFWVNVNGNFLDIAVLEWCKLFADSRGKHYWRKSISDPDAFWCGLMNQLTITDDQFDDCVNQMRTYRDKFVAHLDSEAVMQIPQLDIVVDSTSYLYDYLLANEEEDRCFSDAPSSAADFFSRFLREGEAVYQKAET